MNASKYDDDDTYREVNRGSLGLGYATVTIEKRLPDGSKETLTLHNIHLSDSEDSLFRTFEEYEDFVAKDFSAIRTTSGQAFYLQLEGRMLSKGPDDEELWAFTKTEAEG